MGFDAHLVTVYGIGQGEHAHIHAVAHRLRMGVFLEEVGDGRGILAEIRAYLAVHIVFPRAAGVVDDILEVLAQAHIQSDAAQAGLGGREGDGHIDRTRIIYGVVDDVGALVIGSGDADVAGRAACTQFGGDGGRVDARDGIAEAVVAVGAFVFNPADVAVDRLLLHGGGQEVDALDVPFLDEALRVEDEADAVALDGRCAGISRQGEAAVGCCRFNGGQGGGALLQGELCIGHFVACFAPSRSLLMAQAHVEHIFAVRGGRCAEGHDESARCASGDAA